MFTFSSATKGIFRAFFYQSYYLSKLKWIRVDFKKMFSGTRFRDLLFGSPCKIKECWFWLLWFGWVLKFSHFLPQPHRRASARTEYYHIMYIINVYFSMFRFTVLYPRSKALITVKNNKFVYVWIIYLYMYKWYICICMNVGPSIVTL